MKSVEKYLRKLMKELDTDSMHWSIKGIFTANLTEVNGKQIARVDDDKKTYERCHNHFVWQRVRFEDDYYGTILYPLDGDKYLQIYYEC